MTPEAKYVNNLLPGDIVDFDAIEEQHGNAFRRALIEELDLQGYTINSRYELGEIMICPECEGDGTNQYKSCDKCDGHGTVVDYGKGLKPFKD